MDRVKQRVIILLGFPQGAGSSRTLAAISLSLSSCDHGASPPYDVQAPTTDLSQLQPPIDKAQRAAAYLLPS